MKKYLAPAVVIVSAVLLAAFVVGCGETPTDTTSTVTVPGATGVPGGDSSGSEQLPGVAVQTQTGQGSYRNITSPELAEMLQSKDFVLVNTHVPYEGEIEGTDLFLDYQRAAELMSELPQDKQAKIVVYCRSDRMSTIAAEVWADAGYTNLYQLTGGFVDWEAQGYPLLQLDR